MFNIQNKVEEDPDLSHYLNIYGSFLVCKDHVIKCIWIECIKSFNCFSYLTSHTLLMINLINYSIIGSFKVGKSRLSPKTNGVLQTPPYSFNIPEELYNLRTEFILANLTLSLKRNTKFQVSQNVKMVKFSTEKNQHFMLYIVTNLLLETNA